MDRNTFKIRQDQSESESNSEDEERKAEELDKRAKAPSNFVSSLNEPSYCIDSSVRQSDAMNNNVVMNDASLISLQK